MSIFREQKMIFIKFSGLEEVSIDVVTRHYSHDWNVFFITNMLNHKNKFWNHEFSMKLMMDFIIQLMYKIATKIGTLAF